MLYYLHELSASLDLFRSVTLRAAGAMATALLIVIVMGPRFIRYLHSRRIHEDVTKPNSSELHKLSHGKRGTPTMGGLLILAGLTGSTLLWAMPTNGYVWLTLAVVLALGALGFHDDTVKLTHPKSQGLSIRQKLLWQTAIAGAAALALYFSSEPQWRDVLTVPFLTPQVFTLSLGALFIPFAALVIVSAANAVNLTDGMDGLATGCSLIVTLTYAALAYLAGHVHFAAHLQIPFIPGSEELVVVCGAAIGALLGFLWFNAHPAQVFMGDTGSLPLGGLIAMVALVIKQELLLVLVGGIFVMEALSVLLQVSSFKLRRKRIFRIAPLHHHFQFAGWAEPKIVTRFWIVQIFLALAAVCMLKIR